MPLLQFNPLGSSPSPAFFHALTSHKLDVARLDDGFVPIMAEYAQARIIQDRLAPTSSSSAATGGVNADIGLSGTVLVDGGCFQVDA